MLSAFRDLVKEVTHSSARTFITNKVTYHLKNFRGLQIVLVTNDDNRPEKALYRLGLVFMKEYGYVLSTDWKGDVSEFEEFRRVAQTIINAYFEFDEALLINPTKKFSSVFLFRLDNRLKNTAISLVTLKEGTVEQIAEYSEEDPDLVKENLLELQNLGYVGVKRKELDMIYFYLEK